MKDLRARAAGLPRVSLDSLVPPASIVHALRTGHRVLDREFDAIYPEHVRQLSDRYWTPVDVARSAAALLTGAGASRVLDIGSGVGKFCLIGALTTGATFYGIEHRKHLVEIGIDILKRCEVRRVVLRHCMLEEVRWQNFDAIYLFNPFEENLVHRSQQIDQSVVLCSARFEQDVSRIEETLRAARIGIRVVTYHGFGGWIPESYELVEERPCGMSQLHLWVKTREATAPDEATDVGLLQEPS